MITMEEAKEVIRKYPCIKYYDCTGWDFTADEFCITCDDEDVDKIHHVVVLYYFNAKLKDLNNGNRHYYNEFVINDKGKIEIRENFNINKRKIKTAKHLDEFLADFVYKFKLAKNQCKLAKINKDFQ